MAESKEKIDRYFKAFGAQVRKFRLEKDFSLEELGLRIGVDKSNMQKTENGRPITLKTLFKLCIVLEKSPNDFFPIKFDLSTDELNGLGRVSTRKKKPIKKKKK